MRILKYFFTFIIFVLCVAITPQPAHSQSTTGFDCAGGFQALFPSQTQSIQYKEIHLNSPRNMILHVVKVDLDDDNIDLTTTPQQLLGNFTSTFLGDVGASVAINGSGFDIPDDPEGFNAGQGILYSNEPIGLLTAMISEDNVFSFSYARPNPLWDALSGFNLLIENGSIYDELLNCNPLNCPSDCSSRGYCTIRPRTTLGHSTGNNTLIIIVVEGDGANGTLGASMLDLANIMDTCGADNAINMDGGGSSTLAASATNFTGRTYLNTLASAERLVSNHLGVCIGPCTLPGQMIPLPSIVAPEGRALPRPLSLQYPFPCEDVAPNDAFPDPITGDNEFHSLRPYQASPCNQNKEQLALFCGNDLFVGDDITVTKTYYLDGGVWVPKYSEPPNYPFDANTANDCYYCGKISSSDMTSVCLTNPDFPNCIPWNTQCHPSTDRCNQCEYVDSTHSTEACSFTFQDLNKNISVNLEDAELPFMGYTEPSWDNRAEPDPKVINSINDEETMDHATKMNEYVSWYLNGVNGRAEYPYLDPTLDCVGESTKKPGSCMETQINFFDDGKRDCYSDWGIPFIPSFKQYSLLADGKSVCTGVDYYCCVNKNSLIQTDDTPGSDSIINYSGPIKKLLPFSLQNIERTQEVDNGYTSDKNDAEIRHSQVVGCHTTLLGAIINGFQDGMDFSAPIKCYNNEASIFGIPLPSSWAPLFVNKVRLSEYNENTPPIEDSEPYLYNKFSVWLESYKEWRGNTCLPITLWVPFLNSDFTFSLCFDNPFKSNMFGNIFYYIPFSSTEDRLGDVKIKSARIGARSYSGNIRIIYSRITNIKDADLFFPHMEESVELADLLQKTFAYKGADRDDIVNTGFIPDSPYCSYQKIRENPGDDLFAGELAATVTYTAQVNCIFFEWGGQDGTPVGNLCTNLIPGGICVSDGSYCDTYYTNYDCGSDQVCCTGAVTEFPNIIDCMGPGTGTECVPSNYSCEAVPQDLGNCPQNYKCVESLNYCPRPDVSPPLTQSCTSQVFVGLRLETRTPLASKAWTKLVAGSASVFRKMFTRIGPEENFEGIYDMPASTGVTYSSSDGTVYAGNPVLEASGAVAKLYFPHIGGIKEYFLTGLQALLRPKGMSNQPEFCEGDECIQGNDLTDSGEDPLASTTVDVCSESCSNSALTGTSPTLTTDIHDRFIDLATRWFSGCTPSATTLSDIDSKYYTVIEQAYGSGMNPVFALAIWLNESGASNYECLCTKGLDRAQDFGQNLESLETVFSCPTGTVTRDRFQEQLSGFLNNPWWYLTLCPTNNFACEWERFGALFHYGECTSSDAANTYINEIRQFYEWLAPGLEFPCYPISI